MRARVVFVMLVCFSWISFLNPTYRMAWAQEPDFQKHLKELEKMPLSPGTERAKKLLENWKAEKEKKVEPSKRIEERDSKISPDPSLPKRGISEEEPTNKTVTGKKETATNCSNFFGTIDCNDWHDCQKIGVNHLKSNSYCEAIAALEKAAQLAPNPGYIYSMLANAYSNAGQPEKAAEMRRKMHELSKQNLELAPILSTTARLDDSSGGNGNGQLEAGERGELVVSVSNYGEGAAFNAAVTLDTSSPYVSTTKQMIEILKVNETKEVRFSINIPEDADDAAINIKITARDPREYEYTQAIAYSLKGLIPPKLTYAQSFREDGSGSSSGNGDGIIQNGETVELTVEIFNEGEGEARDVVVEVSSLDENIRLRQNKTDIGKIPPRGNVKAMFTFEVTQKFARQDVPLKLTVSERHNFGLSDKLALGGGVLQPVLKCSQRIDDSTGGNRNNRLEAGKTADLIVTATNLGKGDAIDVDVELETASPLFLAKNRHIGFLRKDGAAQEVVFPIEIPENAKDDSIAMDIVVKDSRGYREAIKVSLPVKGIVPPDLRYSYKIGDDGAGYSQGNNNGAVENGEKIELRLTVQNLGAGKARNVTLHAEPDNPLITMEKDTVELGEIGPAPSEVSGKVVFFVPHDFKQKTFALKLTAQEKYGFGFSKEEAVPVRIVSPVLTYSYEINDMGGQSGYNKIIDPNENITLAFKVKNSGEAIAQSVEIAFAEPYPDGIKVTRGAAALHNIMPGGESEGELKFQVKQSITADKIRLPLVIREQYNRGSSDVIELALGSKQDIELPKIVVRSPRDKTQMSASMLDIDIEVSDNVALAGLSDITLKLNQETVKPESLEISRVGDVVRIKGSIPTMPGDNSLIVMAKDKAGNRASERVTVFARREETVVAKLSGPEIAITSPSNDAKTDREVVNLSARIRDDKGISEYKLVVNGNAFRDLRGVGGVKSEQITNRDNREITLNLYVPLQNGQNTIEITAVDSDNLKKTETVQVTYSSIGEIWAVVVGISKYKDKSMSLEFADEDARSFYDFLLSQYEGRIKKENVMCLLNEEATYENIRRGLRSFLGKATKNDVVLIYFAGHGGPEPGRVDELYLVPYDADRATITDKGIPMDEVARTIKDRIYAERVVLIADACHSGGLTGKNDTRAPQELAALSSRFFSKLAENTGKIIITASDSKELSQEGKQFGGGHGAFTHYLLEGLKGAADGRVEQDGIVTVREAYEYALGKVARATGNKQHPDIKPGVDALLNKDFPLSRVGN
ncbi:MAG: caspase family protein [Candidatus Schekmanbacteria bacterium]|nr:caspase family protein [Candidatus Schekmanbacteria bacterium]